MPKTGEIKIKVDTSEIIRSLYETKGEMMMLLLGYDPR